MIDRRELLERARERGLTLAMIEKDYVLGWLLFGLSGIRGLTFKGGTALSKVYFPRIWRLSEDLDFVYLKDFREVLEALPEMLDKIRKASGISTRRIASTVSGGRLILRAVCAAPSWASWKPKVTRRLPRFSRPASSDRQNTARNLPWTISEVRVGVDRSVSKVPRSFSPAVRSMAG